MINIGLPTRKTKDHRAVKVISNLVLTGTDIIAAKDLSRDDVPLSNARVAVSLHIGHDGVLQESHHLSRHRACSCEACPHLRFHLASPRAARQ